MTARCALCDRSVFEVLFEDQRAAVILHDDWATAGHVMVVWKSHVENISDLTADEWLHLATLYRRTERAVLHATGEDRAIVMKLGIATPHLHLHIYPVSARLDREAVMKIINGETRASRDEDLVGRIRYFLSSPAT